MDRNPLRTHSGDTLLLIISCRPCRARADHLLRDFQGRLIEQHECDVGDRGLGDELLATVGGGAMNPDPVVIADARALARKLLRKPLPERWFHTQGVASRAAEVAVTVPAIDRPMLIAAAWLHDIGYTPALHETGFHPLDGALYLRTKEWDDRLVALVAHHSGARFVPVERGFQLMMAEFDFEDGPVSDALTRSYDGFEGWRVRVQPFAGLGRFAARSADAARWCSRSVSGRGGLYK